MKRLGVLTLKLILFFSIFNLSFVRAQDPSFVVYIDNSSYVATNQFEFDIIIKSFAPTNSFQLRTFQAGIYLNPAWVGAGVVTASVVAGSSGMTLPGYNGNFQWNATDKLINCSVNTGVRVPACATTTVTTAPVRVMRLRISNSIPLNCAVTPDLRFNYSSNPNPLRLRTSVSWWTSPCTQNYAMFYPGRMYNGQAYFNGELWTTADVDAKSPVSANANSAACGREVFLSAFVQGYYDGGSQMRPVLANAGVSGATMDLCDTITLELRSVADPSIKISSCRSLLKTDGTALGYFSGASAATPYWLVVSGRNMVTTWSGSPITLGSALTYDFTSSPSSAYLSNLLELENGVYGIISGDLSQDGTIDAADLGIADFDIYYGGGGYVVSDVTGDGTVDASDLGLIDYNIYFGFGAVSP